LHDNRKTMRNLIVARTPTTKLGLDDRLIANHRYNANRGPANVFAGRLRWQFQAGPSG
jgi:hypothetical protein